MDIDIHLGPSVISQVSYSARDLPDLPPSVPDNHYSPHSSLDSHAPDAFVGEASPQSLRNGTKVTTASAVSPLDMTRNEEPDDQAAETVEKTARSVSVTGMGIPA